MDSERSEGGRPNGGNGTGQEQPSTQQVTEDMRARAEAQRPRAADSAQHAADAARRAAQNLRGEEAWMAGLVEQGADRLADLAQTLRNNDLRTLLARGEDFARRQPVLFTVGAIALGFALSRAVGLAAQGSTQGGGSSDTTGDDGMTGVTAGERRYEH